MMFTRKVTLKNLYNYLMDTYIFLGMIKFKYADAINLLFLFPIPKHLSETKNFLNF